MNEPIDDLDRLFEPHRRAVPSISVEADLAAVRSQSVSQQRRRIFASTAAAGLLLVGGGALAVSNDPGPTQVGVADLAGDNGSGPIDPRPADDSADDVDDAADDGAPDDDVVVDDVDDTDEVDDVTDTDDATQADGDADDADDADDASFPPLPDIAPWPDDIELGSEEFDDYIETQRQTIEEWFEAACDWIDEQHELNGPGEVRDWLDATDLDEWGIDVDHWVVDADTYSSITVDIVDGEVQIDLDGDGEIDRTIDLGADFDVDLDDFDVDLTDLPDIDLPEFDVSDFEVSDFNIENFDLEEFDFGDFDFGDLDLGDLNISVTTD